ncbi:FMRFamide receptor-like [Littorina saxatilis]|uniref:G-protein coupled receptors family 1 profile domain-containing protein n=1 Tax=Littorina saxatilis TaxID=31220 RepID=A0AAN9BZ40_9CAEN
MGQNLLYDFMGNITSDGQDASDVFLNSSDVNVTTPSSRGALPWIVHTTKDFRLATAGIAVFGLIGNTLAIFVLCHRRMWCSTAYLLVILALYDDVILILHIYKVFDNSPLTPGVKIFQTIAFAPIKWTATTGTIYMTLMVTIERFVAVTSPLRSRIIFSLRAARWISLFVFIGSVIYNLPHWFAYVYTTEVNRSRGPPLSEFGRSRAYSTVYKQYCQLALMYVLPWVTMVVLNILLLRTVRSKRAFREASGRSGSTKDLGARLTLPVIAVTFVFFFAYPFLAIEDSLCYEFQCDYKLFIIFTLISEIAKVLNSTANFLFYCFLGRRFRRTFFYMAVSWRSRLSRVVTSKSGDFRYSGDGNSLFKLENRTTNNHSSNGNSEA